MITLGELAAYLALPIGEAEPSLPLHGVAPLGEAGPGELAFVADKRYLSALADTRAGCVLLKAQWHEQSPVPALCTEDPYLSYARASALFSTVPEAAPGVHPSAMVHEAATIGAGVSIGPGASVDAGASVGDDTVLCAGVRVGAGASIGAGSLLYPNVVLYHAVSLGARCIVHGNTTIGSDGFGYARGPQGWEKIHQLGAVRIGDDVEIGANVAIDRGALGDTVIENGVIIDNQVHIAHNCHIGERTAIAGCVGFAGSTTIGKDCTFAGQVGVSGHLRICDNVHFDGQARVTRSIDEPGTYTSGTPLDTKRNWGRNAVRFSQLDAMAKRVKRLQDRLDGLEGHHSAGATGDQGEES